MYPAQADSPDFTLALPIGTTDTSITFNSLTGLLAAPNLLTLRAGDYDTTPETVKYTGISGNTITGVSRGYGGTTAKSFDPGALACRANTAIDHALFLANIQDLATIAYGIARGVATNVSDGGSITHGLGVTPTSVIVSIQSTGAEPTMPYIMMPSVQSKGTNTFTVNIKTPQGDPGNPVTLNWIAMV